LENEKPVEDSKLRLGLNEDLKFWKPMELAMRKLLKEL
jgi:hypothetical protein